MNCGAGEDLRVPWTARRSNKLILKEINPDYSLEEHEDENDDHYDHDDMYY